MILALSLVSTAGAAFSFGDGSDTFARDALKGIKVITVNVDPPARHIYDDLRVRGITAESLQGEITSRLQQAGIQVIDMTAALDDPDAALLNLRVRLVRSSKGVYSYGLYLSANRKVLLGQDTTSFQSVRVWSDYKVGGTSISFLRDVEVYSYELVDRFVADYQRQN